MFIECKVSTSNVNNGMACLEITSSPTYPEDQGRTLVRLKWRFSCLLLKLTNTIGSDPRYVPRLLPRNHYHRYEAEERYRVYVPTRYIPILWYL